MRFCSFQIQFTEKEQTKPKLNHLGLSQISSRNNRILLSQNDYFFQYYLLHLGFKHSTSFSICFTIKTDLNEFQIFLSRHHASAIPVQLFWHQRSEQKSDFRSSRYRDVDSRPKQRFRYSKGKAFSD